MKTLSKILMLFAGLSFLGMTSTSLSATLCEKEIPNSGYLRNFQKLEIGHSDWLFRKHDLITEFGPDHAGYNGLRALNTALAERGTTLVIVPLPTRGIVHPEKLGDIEFSHSLAAKNYSLYLNQLRSVGLMAPELTELTKGDQEHALYFSRDHHWTPQGAKLTAGLIAKLLKEAKILESVASMEFTTSIIQVDSTKGSYSKAALEHCQREFAAEDFNVFHTESKLDIFADVAEPEVVLVGTSNSNGAKNFNFGGYLRESLGVDVLNMATSGGGFDESLLLFLSSKEFTLRPPKVLIWEMPAYYRLKQTSFYESLLSILGQE